GHVQDAQTGLTYMQQRYYDPQIGRFLSMDPVTADANTGGNFNRYWYANNNPYKFIDPDGRVVAYASPELEDQVKAERAESPLLDKQLSYLESSSKTHLVKTERRIGHQSNVNPDGGGAYQHDSGTPGNGSGSVISIKMSAEKVNIAREEGGRAEAVVVSFGEKLSHEFKHAIDMDMGMLSRLRIINEDRAKDVEDMYRQEQGLEGRRQWVK
ncbi:MAG TPA: RHS repeat-associated core domain-containing protein, partial [Pseudolabrys sp.]|nr:RHS repeat-associated core domain-containing protein [Pseudolabrys sp.]